MACVLTYYIPRTMIKHASTPDDTDYLEYVVTFRMSERNVQAIDEAAARAGVSRSDWIRTKLVEEARDDMSGGGDHE